jgi:hypothetical protein
MRCMILTLSIPTATRSSSSGSPSPSPGSRTRHKLTLLNRGPRHGRCEDVCLVGLDLPWLGERACGVCVHCGTGHHACAWGASTTTTTAAGGVGV